MEWAVSWVRSLATLSRRQKHGCLWCLASRWLACSSLLVLQHGAPTGFLWLAVGRSRRVGPKLRLVAAAVLCNATGCTTTVVGSPENWPGACWRRIVRSSGHACGRRARSPLHTTCQTDSERCSGPSPACMTTELADFGSRRQHRAATFARELHL